MQTPTALTPTLGALTNGPSTSLVERTIQFVAGELVTWRDDPRRPHETSEESLNAQLSKHLNVASRLRFPMVHFSHEERQTQRRRVDIAANPTSRFLLGSVYNSIYDPFLVFEGKRLPAPSSDREREYVSGGAKRSGGIQRFKLGLHAAGLPTAVLLGYVQSGTLKAWFSTVNRWILEECAEPSNSGEQWSSVETLSCFTEDSILHHAHAVSEHTRCDSVPSQFHLCHLWIVL